MKRPTPTKEEKGKIREWLERPEKEKERGCPFIPCPRCVSFFPEKPVSIPGDTPCPCAALGLGTVIRIAKEELLNE